MEKEDFYITLLSNGSLREFPNNTNNSFKVRLPRPLRLPGGNWKVALVSASLPDPKTSLPSWMSDDVPLFYASWYHTEQKIQRNKLNLQTSFLLKDINDHVDIHQMTGYDFMKSVADYLTKKQIDNDLVPDQLTGTTGTPEKDFHPTFTFGETDMILDTSKIEFHDFGRDPLAPFGWKSPSFFIHKRLAFEMGWFEEKPEESDPQYAVKLGPNLQIVLNGKMIPPSEDIRKEWRADGGTASATEDDKKRYWIIPRSTDRYLKNPRNVGRLTDYIRLSLSVSWKFTNLDLSFNRLFGSSARTLYVYSDLGQSGILGDQVTDFIRGIVYKREGRGHYWFEPRHREYIPLRKEEIDIIEVQLAEETGSLVKFGQGVTTVTFHLRRQK